MKDKSKPINMLQYESLTDYTNTIAAIYLLDEVMDNGAVITVNSANALIEEENKSSRPKLGNIIKAILQKANTPGEEWQ